MIKQLGLKELLGEIELGTPHIDLPDLSDKVVLVIGASRPSGFGYNLGKVALTECNANVILTVSKQSRVKSIKRSGMDIDTNILDVTDNDSYHSLLEHIKSTYNKLDCVVVAPAYLNPKYFSTDKSWNDVSIEDQEECFEISVNPVRKVAETFGDLLSESRGCIYGVSFPLKDMPGYTIGHAKGELEYLVTDELAQDLKLKEVRANILSLGPFSSISSSVIPSEGLLNELYDKLNIRMLSLGEMCRESISTIANNKTGHIYHIDGGLNQSISENVQLVKEIYDKYTA